MERMKKIAGFWSWLPAFRAVAELEHLTLAAEQMHVSPSALSRSIRQLEDHLGVPLFHREGRLVLNDAGKELLRVVRRAMRLVDDGTENVTTGPISGVVRVAARGSFASLYCVPLATLLRGRGPNLVLEVQAMATDKANAALLAGKIDMALVDDPIPDDALTVELLTKVTYSVYCGNGHPLFEVPEPSQAQILSHAFVGPLPGQNDHWPAEVPRTVAARFEMLHHGVELCAEGAYLAILPDPIGRRYADRLRRLRMKGLPHTMLYAVHRELLGEENKTTVLLDVVRSVTG